MKNLDIIGGRYKTSPYWYCSGKTTAGIGMMSLFTNKCCFGTIDSSCNNIMANHADDDDDDDKQQGKESTGISWPRRSMSLSPQDNPYLVLLGVGTLFQSKGQVVEWTDSRQPAILSTLLTMISSSRKAIIWVVVGWFFCFYFFNLYKNMFIFTVREDPESPSVAFLILVGLLGRKFIGKSYHAGK